MSAAQQVPEKAPDILSPEFARDPYPAYREMRESAPLFWHEATQSWIISRYEDVERVFKDKGAQFTTDNYDWQIEPVHGKTILQLSGREHAVRRALVAPAFRGSDLQEKFLPVIERNSRELIDTFRHTGTVDLVEEYATRFPVNVIADMLGLDKADHARFHGWYTTVIAFLGNLAGDPEVAAAGERTRVEFAEYMIPIIRERRDHLGDDLLSTLCAAEVDGVRMSDEDIKAFCSLLLAAAARDHRQGDRQHLRQPPAPPRTARSRPTGPHADRPRVRRDAAVHTARPHDHAAVGDRRGAVRGHRPRRGHRHLPDRRGQP